MKIITSNSVEEKELPLQLKISFQKIIVLFEKYASQEFMQHPYHRAAKEIVLLFEKKPELKEGFSDYSLLETYKEQIDLLLDQLFPEPLLLNEIKAVMIAEFGCLKPGGSRAKWYRDSFEDFDTKYPCVNTILFFHYSSDGTITYKNVDWYIKDDREVTTAIKDALKKWPANIKQPGIE